MPEPTVPPTRPRRALAALGLGLALGLVAWQVLLAAGGSLPVLGVSAWLVLVLAAAAIAAMAWRVRRERARQLPVDAAASVTRVRLAQASIVAGLLLAGGYASLVASALPGWPAPLAIERVGHGAGAVLGALLWAAAGAWLERTCRISDTDDDTDDDAPDERNTKRIP